MLCLSVVFQKYLSHSLVSSLVRLDDLSLVVVVLIVVIVAVVVPNWTFFLSLMRCRLLCVIQNKRQQVCCIMQLQLYQT